MCPSDERRTLSIFGANAVAQPDPYPRLGPGATLSAARYKYFCEWAVGLISSCGPLVKMR